MRVWLLLARGVAGASAATHLQCTADADCRTSLRSGVHSLFCVDGECRRLKAPGSPCRAPSECASYLFFGPLACTEKCAAGFCCRFIPSGAECSPQRPFGVSGCASGFVCENKSNGPVCTPSFTKGWVFGPVLSVMGNILINIGLNLQKKSYAQPFYAWKAMEINIFLVGIAVYVLGKVSGFSSYVFGNQSLLASLGAVGLVANSIFAPMINKEVFTIYDFCSILFVLAGSSLILSNAGAHRAFSLSELLRMYFVFSTMAWFFFLLLVIAGLYCTVVVVEDNSEWKMTSDAPWIGLDRTFTENGPVLKYAMLFVYVGLSACIASFTTLFAKSFGEMVSITISGNNRFFSPAPYIFLCLIVLCTVGQIYWLNRALKRYDALLVIPIFHVLWTVTSVSTAGIYFKDFAMFTPQQFRCFLAGLFTIFIGSGFLTFRILGKDAPSTETANLSVETKQKST
ncbi:magnesium transporter [Nematocida sp. AWRm77]|nr:magnesium transporter [Nematocida sp. AWRm77]